MRRHAPWVSIVVFSAASWFYVFKTQHPLASLDEAPTKEKLTEDPVAIVYEAKGDVRTKSGASLHWHRVHGKRALYAGDLLFTGEIANARIEYAGIGATVMLGPHSLVTIRKRPPSFSRFRRTFDGNQGKALSEKKTPSILDERTTKGADTTDNRQLAAGSPVFNSGLALIRDVDTIPVIYPLGRVILSAREFPVSLPLQLESTWNQVGLWGYLWRIEATLALEWVGFSRGSFAGIHISQPGEYTLQIVTEDEARTTQPIRISVRRRNQLTLPTWPQASAQNPVTVVLL